MMKKTSFFMAFTVCAHLAAARELNVAKQGADANGGSAGKPYLTISAAANAAEPGDTIIVHQGVYRERINPPRGGDSDAKRIVYEAAPGEHVEICGSELIKSWTQVQESVWKVTLPNTFFGAFNPYSDLIHGDWFYPKGRQLHTGAVYIDGRWLSEAAKLDEVMNPPQAGTSLWFGHVSPTETTIWARFDGLNPNKHETEINVRQCVFYPDRPGRNYITVRGFVMRDAATPWAPPTAGQIGLIGTDWSKGWIIENNVISHSMCSGITLGKYSDEFDNTSADTAGGYVKTIQRALAHGWSAENIGHHIVRNNTISECEQAGICGSMGAVFSQIENNDIHDIHVRNLFGGAEMAGIKLHGAIDVVIKHNCIFHADRGMWMDWMAQGTRITGNLCYDNVQQDLYAEVDHGPYLVDNNLFLSHQSLWDMAEGGAYVHNLFAGAIVWQPDRRRQTPFLQPHSTTLAGSAKITDTDNRFYDNLFVGPKIPAAKPYGLSVYDKAIHVLQTGGNFYCAGAEPDAHEKDALCEPGFDPDLKLAEDPAGVSLSMKVDEQLAASSGRPLVTTALLGKTEVSKAPYENPDASPLQIDTDYFGKHWSRDGVCAGPFADLHPGVVHLQVWRNAK